MRYAVLGDIHSNLDALQTVLGAIEQAGVDRILSVGDVVGYGAAPAACIELLRQREAIVVKGNHDAAVTGELDDQTFNRYARDAVAWTQDQLEGRDLAWLRGLPLMVTLEHCQLAHGNIDDPSRFEYIRTTGDANPSLDHLTRTVGFVGHTHVPIALLRPKDAGGRTAYAPEVDLDLAEAERCLVNVGSVGQPRDEDHRTGWVLFDSDTGRVSIERLEYDIEREAARIREAGLPRVLGDRLYLGV
ncbi:MAG: metallophosphoesterase family protein [Planctomycetota bacterium]|nr:metallophosphoesterase family protein [Planctomycetota bacterium]